MDKLKVIEALAALAQESRLDIFRLLIERGSEGMAMGDIGKKLTLPHATLSFHLEKLKKANLITARKDRRNVIYSTNYQEFIKTVDYLTEHCCENSDENCRIEITNK